VGLVLVPIISMGLYFSVGAVGFKDVPLHKQRSLEVQKQPIEQLIKTAESHLQSNPNDEKGWRILARVYGTLNRQADRGHALRQLIRLKGRSPELLASLGEVMAVQNGNVVSDASKALFLEAVGLDRSNAKSRFYLALALEQEGNLDKANIEWRKLAKLQPDNQEWQSLIAGHISATIKPSVNKVGPTAKDIANANDMAPSDRQVMIESMVEQLAERLEDDQTDFDGWIRLVRSYAVLGDSARASQTLLRAKSFFASDSKTMKQLLQLQRQFSIPEGKAK